MSQVFSPKIELHNGTGFALTVKPNDLLVNSIDNDTLDLDLFFTSNDVDVESTGVEFLDNLFAVEYLGKNFVKLKPPVVDTTPEPEPPIAPEEPSVPVVKFTAAKLSSPLDGSFGWKGDYVLDVKDIPEGMEYTLIVSNQENFTGGKNVSVKLNKTLGKINLDTFTRAEKIYLKLISRGHGKETNVQSFTYKDYRIKAKNKEHLIQLVNDDSIYLWQIDTSEITDLSRFFIAQDGRKNITRTTTFWGMSSWDVSNVTNLEYFYGHETVVNYLNTHGTYIDFKKTKSTSLRGFLRNVKVESTYGTLSIAPFSVIEGYSSTFYFDMENVEDFHAVRILNNRWIEHGLDIKTPWSLSVDVEKRGSLSSSQLPDLELFNVYFVRYSGFWGSCLDGIINKHTTDVSDMFNGYLQDIIARIGVDTWDSGNVTNFDRMFAYSNILLVRSIFDKEPNYPTMDFRNGRSIERMFYFAAFPFWIGNFKLNPAVTSFEYLYAFSGWLNAPCGSYVEINGSYSSFRNEILESRCDFKLPIWSVFHPVVGERDYDWIEIDNDKKGKNITNFRGMFLGARAIGFTKIVTNADSIGRSNDILNINTLVTFNTNSGKVDKWVDNYYPNQYDEIHSSLSLYLNTVNGRDMSYMFCDSEYIELFAVRSSYMESERIDLSVFKFDNCEDLSYFMACDGSPLRFMWAYRRNYSYSTKRNESPYLTFRDRPCLRNIEVDLRKLASCNFNNVRKMDFMFMGNPVSYSRSYGNEMSGPGTLNITLNAPKLESMCGMFANTYTFSSSGESVADSKCMGIGGSWNIGRSVKADYLFSLLGSAMVNDASDYNGREFTNSYKNLIEFYSGLKNLRFNIISSVLLPLPFASTIVRPTGEENDRKREHFRSILRSTSYNGRQVIGNLAKNNCLLSYHWIHAIIDSFLGYSKIDTLSGEDLEFYMKWSTNDFYNEGENLNLYFSPLELRYPIKLSIGYYTEDGNGFIVSSEKLVKSIYQNNLALVANKYTGMSIEDTWKIKKEMIKSASELYRSLDVVTLEPFIYLPNHSYDGSHYINSSSKASYRHINCSNFINIRNKPYINYFPLIEVPDSSSFSSCSYMFSGREVRNLKGLKLPSTFTVNGTKADGLFLCSKSYFPFEELLLYGMGGGILSSSDVSNRRDSAFLSDFFNRFKFSSSVTSFRGLFAGHRFTSEVLFNQMFLSSTSNPNSLDYTAMFMNCEFLTGSRLYLDSLRLDKTKTTAHMFRYVDIAETDNITRRGSSLVNISATDQRYMFANFGIGGTDYSLKAFSYLKYTGSGSLNLDGFLYSTPVTCSGVLDSSYGNGLSYNIFVSNGSSGVAVKGLNPYSSGISLIGTFFYPPDYNFSTNFSGMPSATFGNSNLKYLFPGDAKNMLTTSHFTSSVIERYKRDIGSI